METAASLGVRESWGPVSDLVGFHVDPVYTALAALLVGLLLLERLRNQGRLPIQS